MKLTKKACLRIGNNIESWYYSTTLKAKLNIDQKSFLNEKYVHFLEKSTEIFEKKDFQAEIHPVLLRTVFVLKPDFNKLGKDYSTSDIARLLRQMEGAAFQISVDEPSEFYKKIYKIEAEAETADVLRLIANLEEALRP